MVKLRILWEAGCVGRKEIWTEFWWETLKNGHLEDQEGDENRALRGMLGK